MYKVDEQTQIYLLNQQVNILRTPGFGEFAWTGLFVESLIARQDTFPDIIMAQRLLGPGETVLLHACFQRLRGEQTPVTRGFPRAAFWSGRACAERAGMKSLSGAVVADFLANNAA